MKKILLVDDSEIFLKEASDALTNEGYDVWSIRDTEVVTKVVKVINPDLIILDLNMPPEKEDEIVREVKRELPEIKIIIWGDVPEDEVPLHEKELAGICDEFLKKEVSKDNLKTIRGLLK